MSDKSKISIQLGGFSTLLTIAFIVLKLCNVITWSWFWILSPFWIPAAIIICSLIVFVTLMAFLLIFHLINDN